MNSAHAAIAAIAAVLFSCGSAAAQFADNFDGPAVDKSWDFFAGDGVAGMQFLQRDGYASILVDSTKDQRGIWWALVKRNAAPLIGTSTGCRAFQSGLSPVPGCVSTNLPDARRITGAP